MSLEILAKDKFLERAKNIHGNLYDYSLVEYRHSHKKIKILCKNHGEFEQTPSHHIHGRGCPKCSFERLPQNQPKSTKQFIKEAFFVHKNVYDYSLVEYRRNNKKVIIICKIHGKFNQVPGSHLKGAGCKKCAITEYLSRKGRISKPEREAGIILLNIGIPYISSFHVENKVYDYYIPSKNLLIEIDGIYWHGKNLSDSQLNEIQKINRKNDDIKNRLSQKRGYTLLRIWEDDIKNIPKLIKGHLCTKIFS